MNAGIPTRKERSVARDAAAAAFHALVGALPAARDARQTDAQRKNLRIEPLDHILVKDEMSLGG
jgi:hypothetical protein